MSDKQNIPQSTPHAVTSIMGKAPKSNKSRQVEVRSLANGWVELWVHAPGSTNGYAVRVRRGELEEALHRREK